MTMQAFIEWALSRGWTKDNHGHLQKSWNGWQYRFKLFSTHIRFEVKSNSGWVMLHSGCLNRLKLDKEGRLKGLR